MIFLGERYIRLFCYSNSSLAFSCALRGRALWIGNWYNLSKRLVELENLKRATKIVLRPDKFAMFLEESYNGDSGFELVNGYGLCVDFGICLCSAVQALSKLLCVSH